MSLLNTIKRVMHDPLQTFRLFEILIAAVCIAIPALLKVADIGYPGFRISISAYVYMCHSYIYGMLLTIAAMLFIFNGAVYFKNEISFNLNKAGKWYNVLLGLSLFAVILLPYKAYPTLHYVFAGIFFLGNALVIALFHRPKYRFISLILAGLTVLAIAIHYINESVSLLVSEWISLAVIGIHFILEARMPVVAALLRG